MLKINKYKFLKQCALAKKTLQDVMSCIVDMNGDIWTVDDSHKDYPFVAQSLSIDNIVLFGSTNCLKEIENKFLEEKNKNI
jgi:hypothetical protein